MSFREEQIGDCRLILGNALEVMPTLDPVDLVWTDAPYLVSTGGDGQGVRLAKCGPGAGTSKAQFGGWMKNYGNGGDIVTCALNWADWLPIAFSLLHDDRHAYFMTNGKSLFEAYEAAANAGFEFHTLLPWDKRSALPNRWYQNVCEYTLFMRKGKAFTINDPSSKCLFSMFQRDESEHPTEKPVELVSQHIANSTKPGQTVLDPFMGSGTSGVAARRLGRKFIGIELEERWFDVACERVSRALDQRHIFDAPEPKPIQEALL